MKRTLERRIALSFGSALLVLIFVTGATAWEATRFRDAYGWIRESYLTFIRLDQVLTDVLGMEASARGFLLTGDDSALKPYQAGAAKLEDGLRELRRLAAGSPAQLAHLQRLEPVAKRAHEIMAARIALRRARGLEAVTSIGGFAEGQQTLLEFWQIVRDMAQEERRSLDGRLKGAYQLGLLTISSAVAATVLAAVIVVVAGRRLRRDLTRRREAETALQESLARIEDLYHRAPCGYHSLDANGVILTINDTALGWLGYARDEVVGKMNFTDVLAPESIPVFRDRFQHFMRTGAVKNVEYAWRHKNGAIFPVLLNASAVYDAEGRYVASRATVFDITLRKRAEEERDRFFTMSSDLLSISGFDGFFKRVNPAWERALGLSHGELLASPQIDFVHPDDRAHTHAALARIMAGESSVELENRYRSKEGGYRWLQWSARAAANEQLVFASARDVSDRKEADGRIHALNTAITLRAAQLEAANQELESFSYSVSHDLRAPLRHIDGFASLLTKRAQAGLDDEGRRYLATISKSAKQMGALIDDLLAFSRIGRSPLRLEPVDQNRLVTEVIADGRYDVDGRKIEWEIGQLPVVRADAAMLRQVWTNLLENAVKYTGKQPQPRIVVASKEDAAAGEYVFSVRDNGVGFDMNYADKLFGVFQRLHGPTEFEGTGIGLANVRRIVSRHGGRTWAEGRVDVGADFYFSLPVNVSASHSSS